MLQGLHTRAVSSHYILKHMKKMVKLLFFFYCISEKEQQEAIEHIDEVQNEIDR